MFECGNGLGELVGFDVVIVEYGGECMVVGGIVV